MFSVITKGSGRERELTSISLLFHVELYRNKNTLGIRRIKSNKFGKISNDNLQTSKSSYKPFGALIVVAVVGAKRIFFSYEVHLIHLICCIVKLSFQMLTKCALAIIIINNQN